MGNKQYEVKSCNLLIKNTKSFIEEYKFSDMKLYMKIY